ncbi:MAG TPA: hypothetical protein VGN17_19565 [Bryobacteraceae bacterium]
MTSLFPLFDPVFSFPTDASFNAWAFGIGRQMEGNASQSGSSSTETIDLSLNVHFYFLDVDLGSQIYRARYQRSPGESKFSIQTSMLAASRSTIPTKSFAELADIIDGPSTEQMLVYALPGLKKLAAGKDTETKKDFKKMLEKCRDTPEKQSLLVLLAKP